MSTAVLFEKEDVVVQILHFIAALNLGVVTGGTRIQVFEVTIRHFAGMISAWDLLTGPFAHLAQDESLRKGLYEKMVEMGNILSCAFDVTSGIPRDWLDPVSCQTDDGTVNMIAGIGTTILEFGRLTDITGNKTYVELAERAESYLLMPLTGEPYPGLLGSSVSVYTAEILNARGSWGAFSDCEAQ